MLEFDTLIEEFLIALKNDLTKQTYRSALNSFKEFYRTQGTLKDFLLRVEEDNNLPSFIDRKRLAINTMNSFVEWMKKDNRLKGKTIRTYAGAVQSLVKYFLPGNVKITTRYAGLPSLSTSCKKYPWNRRHVSYFAYQMNHPIYSCLVGFFFQSGIRVPDVKKLTYGDIREECEAGTVPLCLDLSRTKLSKPYLTFVGKAGVKLLHNYLHAREKREKLESDTTLFPVSPSAIGRYLNRRARRLEEYDRLTLYTPGSLSAAFRTLMRRAGCPEEFIAFWTGHKSDIFGVMSKNEWRAKYSKFASAVAFPVILNRREVSR